jgi:putative FmdB family regulatory protein
MPTYDYQCTGCGYRFEMFQGMLEKKLTTCPRCQGALERLIGPGAGIVFKGQGFYQTDYRSSEYRRRAKDEGSAKEGGGGTKGDTSGGAPSSTPVSSANDSSANQTPKGPGTP